MVRWQCVSPKSWRGVAWRRASKRLYVFTLSWGPWCVPARMPARDLGLSLRNASRGSKGGKSIDLSLEANTSSLPPPLRRRIQEGVIRPSTMSERIEPQTLDDLTDVIELLFESGWTDGLPVVPPTPRIV